jgi:hypothetical protein
LLAHEPWIRRCVAALEEGVDLVVEGVWG